MVRPARPDPRLRNRARRPAGFCAFVLLNVLLELVMHNSNNSVIPRSNLPVLLNTDQSTDQSQNTESHNHNHVGQPLLHDSVLTSRTQPGTGLFNLPTIKPWTLSQTVTAGLGAGLMLISGGALAGVSLGTVAKGALNGCGEHLKFALGTLAGTCGGGLLDCAAYCAPACHEEFCAGDGNRPAGQLSRVASTWVHCALAIANFAAATLSAVSYAENSNEPCNDHILKVRDLALAQTVVGTVMGAGHILAMFSHRRPQAATAQP
jgi:hypothetical protein